MTRKKSATEERPDADEVEADRMASPVHAALIVDDRSERIGPRQMRKSEFLDQLEREVRAAADVELARAGRNTQGCPYIERWMGYYRGRATVQVESALRRYAPEAVGAKSASEYISVVVERIRTAVSVWAVTGRVTGVPGDLAGRLSAGGLPAVEAALTTAAISSASPIARNGADAASSSNGIPGSAKEKSGDVDEKTDPLIIQSKLGAGESLDGGLKSRMESAFGHDFSRVRVHKDSRAASLSSAVSARAFTIGSDIAFAAGEYQPGSLIGDALIAHELAHVVQQGAGPATGLAEKSSDDNERFEQDADIAAASAVASVWSGSDRSLERFGERRKPSIRSGLGLRRCKQDTCSLGVKTVTIDLIKLRGSTRTPSTDLSEANKIYRKCCVQFTKGQEPPIPNNLSDSWIGDTDVQVAPNCGAVGGEEKAMYDGATSQYSLSSRMRAFYVQTFSGYNSLGYSIPPYCATGNASAYANHLVIQDSGLKDTLAHELGHILLNSGDHHGIDNPSDKGNLMVSPGRTSSDIDASQCKTIYNNA